MHKRDSADRRCRTLLWLALIASGLAWASTGRAQLAITEVLTSALTTTNLADQWVWKGSDFWELTNFGTNSVDLAGYSWSERKGSRNSAPFAGVRISPGESILFFRLSTKDITDADAFRQWWGLADGVQVIPWGLQPGLSSSQEDVQLWNAEGILVDSVSVGQAQEGVSFTYDTESGMFGVLSVKGIGGAFKAATADDVGSPGTTAGSVPPQVIQAPTDIEVDGGQEATFTVRATGIPPPQYRWEFKGNAISWATSATLTITNVEPANAGLYQVHVSNCAGPPTNLVATLTVNTNPCPPTIIQGLCDTFVYPGQTASFTVRARGYPSPSYQWRSNDVDLPDVTGTTLVVSDAQEAQSGTRYTVEAHNSLGRAESSARLWVHPKPKLFITEVMAWPSTNSVVDHSDWWELTNLDTNAVSLPGWKFFDNSNVLALGTPCAVTQAVTIQPGESIVFAKRTTPEAFVAWWGATNLPPNLTIIPYDGFSLASEGDTLFLWNPAATGTYDAVASVMFAMSTNGKSIHFLTNQWEIVESEVGVDGAFRAAESDDVGSPGYSSFAPPRFLRIAVEGEHVTLTWQAVAGRHYLLQRCAALGDPNGWASVGTHSSPGRSVTVREAISPGQAQRFYRVETVP